MAATALAVSGGKTKSTGGATTNALGPLSGLTMTIPVSTSK